ncbi:SMI1/KNR4 family protein [Pimelobacter simplex]|uniref:SMI1/KNR4 family protein n=1 Tax=Nocardioides simplex TaxID=2045 RepID=UPI001933BF85|nr:SMI1/KNR4 family protein [Pimelobacter simplex]
MEHRVAADDLATLLQQWSDTQLAALDDREVLTEEAARSGSLLRAPATAADVDAAERRLGTRFPPSYRAFLLLSDGAYGDTAGPVTTNSRVGALGFLPAAEVRWYREAEPAAVDGWVRRQDEIDESRGAPDPTEPHEYGEVRDHRPVRDALLVARGFDADCSLLVPVGSPGPDEEWELWDVYPDGARRWSSFRAFLRDAVEDELGIDADEATTRELVSAARAGDSRAPIDLGRIRSPEAAPVLMEAAGEGAALRSVLKALARIGGPEVVAFLAGLDLRSWRDDERLHALATIGTPDALDRLAAAGAFDWLSRLGDPRAAEIAAGRLRTSDDVNTIHLALTILRAAPDPRWVPDLVDAHERVPYPAVRAALLDTLAACGAHDTVRALLDGPAEG